MYSGSSVLLHDVPVLAFYQTPSDNGGKVVVFGDSNCLDSAHQQQGVRTYILESTLFLYIVSTCMTIESYPGHISMGTAIPPVILKYLHLT